MRGVLIADKQRGLRPEQLIYESNRQNKFVLIYQIPISCESAVCSECRLIPHSRLNAKQLSTTQALNLKLYSHMNTKRL